MKEEDWIQIHKMFTKNIRNVNHFLEITYGMGIPYWELALTEKPSFNQKELLSFHVAIYLQEGIATILRDISIEISPILFVSYHPSCGIKECIDIPSCLSFFENLSLNKCIAFSCAPKYSPKRYKFELSEKCKQIDELGNVDLNFEDLDILNPISLPSHFKEESFSAVGEKYYAPNSATTFDCILFAQKQNKYDENAIQIRRWFPVNKGEENNLYTISYTFEYGFISKEENRDLHTYMINSNSRILFAKFSNKKVNILGGIEVFKNELFNYFIPPFILPYLK